MAAGASLPQSHDLFELYEEQYIELYLLQQRLFDEYISLMLLIRQCKHLIVYLFRFIFLVSPFIHSFI